MITQVTIYLDEEVPEYMAGIMRCGSVISEDENGNETDHQELIDNDEYHSGAEMITGVASKLGVNENIVVFGD